MRCPIVLLREKNGMTQEEFAQALGISVPTLRMMETGVMRHSQVLFSALERAGYNSEVLARKYQNWRRLRSRPAQRAQEASA